MVECETEIILYISQRTNPYLCLQNVLMHAVLTPSVEEENYEWNSHVFQLTDPYLCVQTFQFM